MTGPRDLILAIETSNPSAWRAGVVCRPGVAVGRQQTGGEVLLLGVEEIDPTRLQDDDLVPAIDRLFQRIGLAPQGLAGIAVSIGPGGYTAVRLAVTTAKMIAEATGAACLPIPTAQVVARRVTSGGRAFAVALASKGETAFVTPFHAEGGPAAPGSIIDAQGLAALEVGLLIADRFLPAAMRACAGELAIEVREPVFDPTACFELAATAAPIDPLHLVPAYAREPEAVTKWRQLHGG